LLLQHAITAFGCCRSLGLPKLWRLLLGISASTHAKSVAIKFTAELLASHSYGVAS